MLARKYITRGIVLICALSIIAFTGDAYLDKREDRQKHQAYAQLIPLIGIEAGDNLNVQADKIRLFIFTHTRFGEGDAFRQIWGDHETIAARIAAAAQGEAKPPPLECSSRSGAMESLLITLGYEVRSVSVYGYKPGFPAHSFLEVRAPGSDEWQVQDPQFNVFWRDKKTGERLGIRDLVAQDFSRYEPCITPDQCGWNLPNREGHDPRQLRERFGLASVKDYQRGRRPLFVNTTRFPLEQPLEVEGENLTYCDYLEKNCRDTITLFGKN